MTAYSEKAMELVKAWRDKAARYAAIPFDGISAGYNESAAYRDCADELEAAGLALLGEPLSASVEAPPQDLRGLLNDAFEAGHMAFPGPDIEMKTALRDHIVANILERVAASVEAPGAEARPEHDKIIALLKSVAAPCETKGNNPDHAWRKCRHCLALAELDHQDVRQMLGDALLSALSRPASAEWHDMITAPEDRTPILVWENHSDGPRRRIVTFVPQWGWLSVPGRIAVRPQGWMPLPDPPAASSQEAKCEK